MPVRKNERTAAAVRRLIAVVVVAVVHVLTATSSFAATTPPSSATGAVEEAADSPRASVRSFMDLCDRGRYEEAARYIDVPRGAEKRAADSTRKLYAVLQERLWVDPEKLSPLAKGSSADGLPAGTEEIGKITDAKGHGVPIRLVRHESRGGEDESRWLFSQTTVQAMDALYANLNARFIRDHLPASLTGEGPHGLYWWQWIALPLLAAICVALGRLLAAVSEPIASRLATWTSAFSPRRRVPEGTPPRASWPERIVARLKRPVTMGWALLTFWCALPYLGLTLQAEDLLERLLTALAYLAFFWGLFRSVTVAGDELAQADWARAKPSARSLASMCVRLGKLGVAAIALMVALSELGYPVTSVVAGLGIGGVALALAAQKTVENLFGSISILADQPFQIGDTIRVDTVEGTVESIGLRSTRLRTVERTLVVIPNGKLADMRIESLGARDRIRFSVKLPLPRDAKIEAVTRVVSSVRERLAKDARVHGDDLSVRVAGLGDQSYDVDVSAPVRTIDPLEFAKIREELLLACLDTIEKSGVGLAIPTRRIIGSSEAGA